MLIPVIGFSQTLKLGDGIQVVHFNAGWNSAADVEWVDDLENCKIKRCDIAVDTKAQNKFVLVLLWGHRWRGMHLLLKDFYKYL